MSLSLAISLRWELTFKDKSMFLHVKSTGIAIKLSVVVLLARYSAAHQGAMEQPENGIRWRHVLLVKLLSQHGIHHHLSLEDLRLQLVDGSTLESHCHVYDASSPADAADRRPEYPLIS